MKELLRRCFSAIVLSALWCALPLCAQSTTYYIVLDGITKENMPDYNNLRFDLSLSEKLLDFEATDNQKDLSDMGSTADLGFTCSKVNAKFQFGKIMFSYRTKEPVVYYRLYSPHFTDVQKGMIDLTTADANNHVHLDLLKGKKCITVNPVKGRDGQAVNSCAFFPNAEYGIYSYYSKRLLNGVKIGALTEFETYTVFADKGSTMEYVLKPDDTGCALAVCQLAVSDDDAPQSIDADYSKAKRLRLFVADGKGYVGMVNPQLQCTFYTDNTSNWGWGTYYGGMRLDNKVVESDSYYNWVETYALPGSKLSLEIYNVYEWNTPDEYFLAPYNCPTPYMVKEVEISAEGDSQDVIMGTSDPRDVYFTIKGGAPMANVLDLNVKAYYDFKHYPFPDDAKWDLARFKEVSRTSEGNDLTYHLKVSGVAPKVTITPQVNLYAQYNDTLWKANESLYGVELALPEAGSAKHIDMLDLSKVHAVTFKARHGFLKKNCVGLHGDAFLYDESITHAIEGHQTDDNAVDAIVVYLAEGDYQWYTLSSSTGAVTSGKTDFHVGGDQVIIVDPVLEGIPSVTANGSEAETYYSVDGKRLQAPVRGVNIVRTKDGKARKVVK